MSNEELARSEQVNRSSSSPCTQVDRGRRIEDLRRAIDDGTYEVSAEDVAEKIINRFMRQR